MSRRFSATSADELWSDLVDALRTSADSSNQPSRIGLTREILHATLELTDPRRRWVIGRRPALNPAFAIAEIVWIVRGRQDSLFLSYFNHALSEFAGGGINLHGAYGYRLRRHFGFDQLEAAYQALLSNPASRQVVLQIWDAKIDLPMDHGKPRDSDIPCNTQSYLKIRNGKLEWMQCMRSNDVYLGLPYNLVQFSALQEIVAGWLGIEVGSYHHFTDSLHVYEKDLNQISFEKVTSGATESLALPKTESDSAFLKLENLVECIIDANVSAGMLLEKGRELSLPTPFANLAYVLLAEGMRRRNSLTSVEHMIELCRNEVLRSLARNWHFRVSRAR